MATETCSTSLELPDDLENQLMQPGGSLAKLNLLVRLEKVEARLREHLRVGLTRLNFEQHQKVLIAIESGRQQLDSLVVPSTNSMPQPRGHDAMP